MATLGERAHTNVELLIFGVKTKLGKCCLFRGDYKSNIKFLASQFVCFGNKYLTVARIDAPQRICPHWLIGRTVARLSMIVFEIERWESRVGGGFPSGNQFVWFGPSAAFAWFPTIPTRVRYSIALVDEMFQNWQLNLIKWGKRGKFDYLCMFY